MKNIYVNKKHEKYIYVDKNFKRSANVISVTLHLQRKHVPLTICNP